MSSLTADPDCLFCKIVAGDIPTELRYQDDEIVAFNDINPQAPLHCLVIPRRHIATLDALSPQDAQLAGRMVLAAAQIAREQGVAEAGYRLVMNCNQHGGQSVYHLHLHLLAGRQHGWPPG